MDLRKLDLKIVKVLCGMVGHLNHLMVAHTASPSNYCHQGHRLPLMQSVYHDLGLNVQNVQIGSGKCRFMINFFPMVEEQMMVILFFLQVCKRRIAPPA